MKVLSFKKMRDQLHLSCSSAFLGMRKRFLVGSVSISEKTSAGCVDGLLASKLPCIAFCVTQKHCFNSAFKILIFGVAIKITVFI